MQYFIVTLPGTTETAPDSADYVIVAPNRSKAIVQAIAMHKDAGFTTGNRDLRFDPGTTARQVSLNVAVGTKAAFGAAR